jgi:hypothetical protein
MTRDIMNSLSVARKAIRESDFGEKGLCSVGIVNSDGSTTVNRVEPCFYSVALFSSQNAEYFIFSPRKDRYHIRRKSYKKEERKYIYDLIHHSHWSPYYVDRNVSNIIKYGTIFHTNAHPSLLVMGAVLDRMRYEDHSLVTTFCKMRDNGLSCNEALIYSAFMRWQSDIEKFEIYSTEPGHRAISPAYITASWIRNFLAGQYFPSYSPERTMKDFFKYRGYSAMWGGGRLGENLLRKDYIDFLAKRKTVMRESFGREIPKTCNVVSSKDLRKSWEHFCEVNGV